MLTRTFTIAFAVAFGAGAVEAQDDPLSTEEIRHTITESAMIMGGYVIAEKRDAIAEQLRARAAEGDYDHLTNWPALAAQLQTDLVDLTDDLHFSVTFDPETIASWEAPVDDPEEQLAEYRAQVAAQWRARAQGVRDAAILPGDIGYVRLDYVAPPTDAAVALWDAAFALVHDADALILDLRTNRGGSPDGVAELVGRFMGDTPVHYASIQSAHGPATELTSKPGAPATSFLDRPVFVLISRHTGSAGEAIAYHLRALGRAVLVGETTAGGAHPTSVYSINDYLIMRIPTERVVSAITDTNWEGVGVAPDEEAAFDEALPRAELLAVDAIEAGDADEDFAGSRAWLRSVAAGALEDWTPTRAELDAYAGDYPGAGRFSVRDGALWRDSDNGDARLLPVAPDLFRHAERDELVYRFNVDGGRNIVAAFSDGRETMYERGE